MALPIELPERPNSCVLCACCVRVCVLVRVRVLVRARVHTCDNLGSHCFALLWVFT